MVTRAPAAATALAILLGAGTPALAGAPAPLEQARQAAERTSFEGVLEVRWRDGDVSRSERLDVEAAGGALVVRGANLVMARPAFSRLLAHKGGGWEEMWLPSRAPSPRPEGIPKYVASPPQLGPTVAGRPTKILEVSHEGRLLERMYLDTATDLLLRRDQYDAQGGITRTLAFQSLVLLPSATPPAEPRSLARSAPRSVSVERLASPAAAPPVLADGYERMGIYRNGSVLQVHYSDGMYDLSLFEQEGRLRRSDLPSAGERVSIRGTTGWRYAWPGGQLLVWSAGGSVFTAVSDAPPDQVVRAVRSLPPVPARELSLLDKVRRACQAVMEPLS